MSSPTFSSHHGSTRQWADTFHQAHCNEETHIITQNGIIYGTAGIDIFTDLLILSLPFLILRGVKMPKKYKTILSGIFSLTVIVITVAVVRCIELKTSQHSEIQVHSIDWLFLWSNIELGVGKSEMMFPPKICVFRAEIVNSTQRSLFLALAPSANCLSSTGETQRRVVFSPVTAQIDLDGSAIIFRPLHRKTSTKRDHEVLCGVDRKGTQCRILTLFPLTRFVWTGRWMLRLPIKPCQGQLYITKDSRASMKLGYSHDITRR